MSGGWKVAYMLCRQQKSSSDVIDEFVKDGDCGDELLKEALSEICTVNGTDYFQSTMPAST